MVWKPHVTVAAIVERENRFLMVEENIFGSPLINQPAGHLEEGESLLDAVSRETTEETGWIFVPRWVIGIHLWRHPGNSATFLRVSFAGDCTDFDPSRELDSSIIQTLWLSRNDLEIRKHSLRSPMVLRCIDDYLNGSRYALSLLQSMLS
ncbi:MAG: NUDIX hydrolase [Methylococcales bacterium]